MECFATTFLKLKQIRFGHEYPGTPVNIRVPTRADGERLAPSLRSDGLLQALCVWPDPEAGGEGPYYTMVGGRRLMGLHVLRESGDIDDETPISVVIAPTLDAASALAKSLAAEDAHVPPHPVDRYEAFARIAAGGMETPDIAARFFVEEKIVRQALALGALAPEVRELWRKGEISAEIAQNFTLADGHKQQIKVLDKLRKRPGGLAHLDVATVRKQFTGSEAEATRLLKFVGRSAYVDAGGALTEDLFSPAIVIHNFAILKRLAEEKLEREAARLTKGEGWSFAEPQLKTSYIGGAHIEVKPEFTEAEKKRLREIDDREKAIQRIETEDDAENLALSEEEERLGEERDRIETAAKARAFNDKQKAKAGCIIRITSDGEFDIDYGVTKAPEPAARATGFALPKKPEEPEISYEALRAMQGWKNAAAGEALQRNPQLALATFLATLQDRGGPIGLEMMFHAEAQFVKAKGFKAALAALMKLPFDTLVNLTVKALADSVTLDIEDDNPDDVDFAAMLDAAVYGKALARNFNAKTYFEGCSKKHLLDIVFATLGADAHLEASDKSKTDLAKLCVDKVAPLGWLPPELRSSTYTDPKPPAAAKPAAKPGSFTAPTKKKARPAFADRAE